METNKTDNELLLPIAVDLTPDYQEMCGGSNPSRPSSPVMYEQPIEDDLLNIELPLGSGWNESELGTGTLLELLSREFEDEFYENDVQKLREISEKDSVMNSIEIREQTLFKEFEDLIGKHNEPEKSKENMKSIQEKVNFLEINMKKLIEKQEAIEKQLIEVIQVQEKLLKLMKQHTDHECEKSEIQTEKECLNVTIKGNRWRKAEVDVLIQFRAEMERKFQCHGLKYHLWKEISNKMCSIGYNRTAKKCKEKWDNINKYYKKVAENKKKPKKLFRCSYFRDLALLHNETGVDQQAMDDIGVEIESNVNAANSEMENSFCDSIS